MTIGKHLGSINSATIEFEIEAQYVLFVFFASLSRVTEAL